MLRAKEFYASGLRRRAAYWCVAVSLCCVMVAIAAPPLNKLPRKFGPVNLAMSAKEFKRTTGVEPAGECEDCIDKQNVAELDATFFSRMLDWFPNLARKEASEAVPATVFFYRGKLEFVLFTMTGYDYQAVKQSLVRTLGESYRQERFPRRCIYAGGESLTWTDPVTTIVLTEYRDKTGNQLELKLADKALLEEAERIQDVHQQDLVKQLEKEGNC